MEEKRCGSEGSEEEGKSEKVIGRSRKGSKEVGKSSSGRGQIVSEGTAKR